MRVKNNKIVLAVATVTVSMVIGWSSWVTDSVYTQEKEVEVLREDVKELKEDVKELNGKVEEVQREQKDNFKDTMKILLDIQKQVGGDK